MEIAIMIRIEEGNWEPVSVVLSLFLLFNSRINLLAIGMSGFW
jgi:hypothetical protein